MNDKKAFIFVTKIGGRNSKKTDLNGANGCNKFRRDINNDYINSSAGQQFILSEYIDELPNFSGGALEKYADLNGISNMG